MKWADHSENGPAPPYQPPAPVCRSALHHTRRSWPTAADNHSSGLPHLQTGQLVQQHGQSRAHSWQQTAPPGDDQLGGQDSKVVKWYLDFKKQREEEENARKEREEEMERRKKDGGERRDEGGGREGRREGRERWKKRGKEGEIDGREGERDGRKGEREEERGGRDRGD